MTSYEPRGRKVTDPRPVRPNYEKRVKPASGLEKAWEEMNMAKSVLRRAELNLREVDYPPVSNISATNVQIDKVPKYFIDEKPVKEQVIVDKYGRTSHMKTKFTESKRKIVPLDDRFQEDAVESESTKSRKRSPLREPNILHPSEEGHLSRAYTSLSSKLRPDDDLSNPLNKYNQKYKKVDRDDDIFRRDDDIFRRDAYYKNPTKDSDHNGDLHKVAHDADVRYLNDFSSISDHSEKLVPSHLTKVPVSVPSVTMSTSQNQHSAVGSRTGHGEGIKSNGLDHQMKLHAGYSGPKLKDILKSSNPNNEGLSKVRELIEKQKNVMNGVGNEETLVTKSKDHLTDSVPELPQRILHNLDEPVRSQKYDVYLDQPPPIPARKIATGCRVPSYRGFSETEPLRDPSKMQAKIAESRRKTSKPSSQPQLQTVTHVSGPKHQSRDERKTSDGKSDESKKLTRLVAQKRPAKSEVITTHSWREGQKAILKELGPQKMAKMSTSLLTTDRDTQKEEHCSRHTKKQSHTDYSKTNGLSQTALSAEAQSVLADLHGNKSDEENNEERSKTQYKSSRRKRSKTPEKETSEKPLTKIRHYDSNEVRKYIAKQRAEKKRKQQEEEERRRKEEEARNKMLKELYKKQKACARASQPKSDNLQFKLEPPDSKQRQTTVDTDKDSLSGESSGNSTLTEVSREKKTSKTTSKSGVHWAKEEANRDILLRKYLGSSVTDSEQSDLSKNSLVKKPGQLEPDARLKAGEIVKQITEKSGLSVDDFVNKYAHRAEAIKSTFMTQHDPLSHNDKLFTSRNEPLETSLIKPSKNIAAKLDRIQAIKNIATSLQTRVQLEAQRLASAVPLIADKWNKPKEDSDFVSRYQLITGRPENVFGNDVPGVRNLHSLAEKSDEEGTKIKAATKIQAAFRGHNVRQGLAWRCPEHKTVGYKLNNNTCKEFHSSDSDGLSDSTLTEESLPDDGHNKKPSVVPPYIPARGIKPSKPVPAWDQQTPDPYTFYSVYSRKKNMLHKPRIPTPPLSDDDEEMRELTEPPPPPPVPIIPVPFRIRKPRAMSPGSDVSDTASSIQEDLPTSDQYNEDFTGHESTSQSKRSQKGNKSSDQVSKRTHGDGVASEDDNDSLNRTLTESTSSETSRKLKDPSQSHSLVLSSKTNVISPANKEIDWSDVSSLTDESENSFHDASSQSKLPYTKLSYHGNQWSPGVLHHRMTVELNYLEGVQESIQQLAHVERTRGIALAQQETVSLAQVLKARQQAQAVDIAEIQIKAKQESLEVVSQLQNNQQAAAAGPNNLSKLDHSTQYSLQEHSQYSRTNSQYSYTEEQAVSYTSESYDSSYTKSYPSNKADNKKSLEIGSSSEVKTAEDLSKSSTSTIKTATISTASDLSGDKKSTDSSICTESGVKNDVELSQTESVPEEIGSEHDYTADFDTEEELECSLREMLPSEGQRKKLKRQTSKDLSLLGDDSLFPAEDQASSRRLSFEEDSFSRFNVDMVRQYLRDDEIRERHQHALLKLREQALVEKTKAELAWLEQQKKQIKSKGADDAYPRLKQKERGIIRRLKQEQAELKRLQEVQREASRKRLLMLKESQEIVKIQKSAQHVRQRLKEPVKSSLSLSEIAGEVATDEEDLDGGSLPTSPSKEKSDSEIAESFHKLKLMTLNKKYMTRREKKLQQRREMANLEKQKTNKRTANNSESAYEMTEGADSLQLTTPRTPRTQDSIQESIHAEMTDRSRESTIPEELPSGTDRKSTYTSISEEISTSTPSTVKKSQFTSISERVLAAPSSVRTKSCLNTATDTSIQEETHNETETNISVNVDYTNDTFESEPVQTENNVSKAKDTSTSVAANKSSRRTEDNGFGIGLHTPSNNNNNFHKTSESESEDSFSVAPSETSDSSDVKARIRELSEELKRRKIEAERLKRQHEQRQKEKLREKEEYLRKQIENYNNYISHVKTELNHGLEIPEHQGAPKRPQIKPQSHAITKTTDRPKSVDKTGHQDVDVSASSATTSGLSRTSKDKAASPKDNEVVKDSVKSLPPSRDDDVTGSISEEIIEAAVTSTGKSELKLDLQEKEGEKVQVVTPRSVHESRLDTARSVTEIPEDLSLHTDRSESSQHASPRLDDIAESPQQTSSKKSEPQDENSELSEASHTDKSTSYQSESSACLEKSKSYTDDYTDDSESSTTISTHTPRSKTPSERSVAQASHAKSMTDPQKSIPTQDDISESLTEELESEEQSKSEVLFKLDDVPKAEVADGLPDVSIGDRVSVGDRVGTLRFRDFVRFAPGLHAGIELDSPEGDHDGTVEGIQYFSCPPKHGVIVPVDQITRVEEEAPKSVHGNEIEDDKDVVSAVEETQTEVSEGAGVESDIHGTPRMDDVSVSDIRDEPSKSESISLPTATPSEAKDPETDTIHTKVRVTGTDVKDDMDTGIKVVESEVKADRTEDREKECEKATDLAVQNLLNEAISQMMTIRQQKRIMLQKASDEGSPTTDSVPDSHQKQDALVENITEQTPRPLSPQNYRTDEFLDDDIYDFNNDGEDPWNDDDLGFGLSRKPSPAQAGILGTDELKLDLSKLTEPVQPEQVLYVVPHTEPDVSRLVSDVVDVFWERRRYGESWSNVEPPPSYYAADESGSELDLHTRRVYKRLVFDLTAHILREMYEEEEDDDDSSATRRPAWMRQRLSRLGHARRRLPPTTVDSLKPIVERQVCHLLGLRPEPDGSQARKWSSRKKKDRVDQILVQELRHDEPQWVSYDDDELAVKMQLTNALFDSLLADTAEALKPAFARWSQKLASSSSSSSSSSS